jgi:protein-tyrosine phosphatase
MANILFVCSANRFRSVIAEEYFRSLLLKNQVAGEWTVSSAGTWAKNGILPISEAVRFAKGKGLNIDNIRSREVTKTILEEANLIIVMSEGQREALSFEFQQVRKQIFLLSEICEGQTYDIPDPVEKTDESFDEIALEICSLLDRGLNAICKKAMHFYKGINPPVENDKVS